MSVSGLLYLFAASASAAPPVLPVDVASAGVERAMMACGQAGFPVTVIVADPDAYVIAAERADGTPGVTFEFASRKAYTVAKTGMATSAFRETLPEDQRDIDPKLFGGRQPPPGPVKGDPRLEANGGGLPIVRGKVTVGIIAVSGAPGGDKDERCAEVGRETIQGLLAARSRH